MQFVNTAFWGPGRQIVIVNGTGVVGFIGCTFRQWNDDKKGRYAIQAHGGTLIVQGSEFQQKAPQVILLRVFHLANSKTLQIFLGKDVRRAVILGNVITGPINITNNAKGGSIEIGMNVNMP